MTLTLPQSQSHLPLPSIPPLANGDRLTRLEFERRYCNMTKIRKAELIEGVVYLDAPVSFTFHAEPPYLQLPRYRLPLGI